MGSTKNSGGTQTVQSGPIKLEDSFYRALYLHSNDGIMLLQNGRFVDCNQRLLQLLGRKRKQVVGHTPADISPPQQADGQDSKTKARDYVSRGLKGERQIFEWIHTRGDGSPIDIEVSLSKITHQGQAALLCHLRDITQRKRIENALKEREEQYRRIVQDQLDFIVRWLPDGTRTFVNDAYCRYFGKSRQELVGENLFPLIPPQQQQAVRDKIAALTPAQPLASDEHQAVTPSGELRWHHWLDRAFFNDAGHIVALQSVGRDIHDKKMAQEALRISEEKFSKAFHASPEAIIITRIEDGTILEANEGFTKISGYSIGETIGKSTLTLGIWANPMQRDEMLSIIRQHHSLRDFETKIRIKSGEIRDCLTSAEVIDFNGEGCLVSVTRDITDTKKITRALEYQATHDPLTGLYNRNWLKTRIDELVARDTPFALLILDLDQFKEINDTLGHHTGDHLLKQVGPKLKHTLEHLNGELARLGGDEFAMVLHDTCNQDDVASAAAETLKALEKPFYFESMRLELGASLGIAFFPEDGRDTHTLLRCADVAMYVSKEQRYGYSFYQTDIDRHSTRRLALISELRNAISDDQLRLCFQPKINLDSMELIGFEALVRWQHPQHGLIPPAQFVPFAELSESIHPMTYWVMENAIRECRKWHQRGHMISVSVNLSTRNLLNQDCSEKLETLLDRYGLAPEYVEFEITESALIKDPERVLKNLNRLHRTGAQLAIDDFGTGYSSMAYLKRMPLHALKIDLSFVTHMLQDKQDEIIVKSTINLAHNLGLTVVAEGVENRPTFDALRGCGCDVAQGYFIAAPLPQSELEAWINNNDWHTAKTRSRP